MSRRRRYPIEEFPLPWQAEAIFWLIGVLCALLGMWWMLDEITSPAAMFSEMLGVTVQTQPIVDAARPLIWLFGLLVGVRVRFWLRRIVVDQLTKIT